MSTRAVKFNIDLTANPQAARQLEAALKRLGQTGRQAGREIDKGFSDVGGTVSKLKGAIVALGAGMVMRTFVRNTIEAEQALAQLDAILLSTGNAAGFSRKQLLDMARELSGSSIFDEQAIISAQTRLLSYSGIVGENLPRAMQSVIDQSTRLGISVEQSAETIGRALESPSKAAAALAQQGFGAAFTKEVRGTIDALVAAGREGEAQIMILEILEESYGGAAQAARDTFGGAVASLKNALKSLLTGDTSGGGLRGATDGVNDLAATLNDPQTQQGFQTLISGALQAVGALARFASTTASVAKFIGEEIASRVHGPAAEDVVRVEQRIERLKQTLRGLDAVDQRGPLAWFSQDFLKASEFNPSDFVKPVSEVRARLQAELDKEEAKLKVGIELNEAAAKLVADATAAIETPRPPRPPPLEKDKKKSGKSEAEKLQDAYARVNAQLQEQIALFGRSTEGARILHEVQEGSLRNLEEPQKQQLLDLAHRLDAMRELAEATAAEAAERESAEREARALVEATYTAEERHVQLLERAQQLRALGLLTQAELVRVVDDSTKRLAETLKSAEKQFEEFGEQAARNVQTAFADFLFDPFEDGLSGMLKGFVDVVRRMLSEALAAQLLKALFGKMEGAADGADGTWGALLKGFLGSFGGGSAKGNVFAGGAMVPFANGGIVKGPITFPMANGQFGLMGEAGPEAIMPLRRGPGGRLGVDAGGGGRTPDVNIRQIVVRDDREAAEHIFSAQNERVIVTYLNRLGFGGSS